RPRPGRPAARPLPPAEVTMATPPLLDAALPSRLAVLGEFVGLFWPVLLAVALGLAAGYLLLPPPRGYPALWGAVAGVLGLIVAGWLLIRAEVFSAEAVLFYGFSALAVVGGVLLVTQRNPVYAALSFALVVLSTCGLFLLQAAPFLMA